MQHPRSRHAFCAISAHEILDQAVQLVPRGIDEVVVAYRKCRTDKKFLIRAGAARVVRANEIPSELEQLHAVDRGKLTGGPEGLEQIAQLRILQHVDACRELKLATAHQLAQDIDQLGMMLHCPIDRAIEIAADVTIEARGLRCVASAQYP